MADVDAALLQQVFDIAERQMETDVDHHRQADDLWAGLERPKGGSAGSCRKARGGHWRSQARCLRTVLSSDPRCPVPGLQVAHAIPARYLVHTSLDVEGVPCPRPKL